MYDYNDEHEIGDKVESFIKLMHQVCSADEKRTANVKNFRQQHECKASRNTIKLNYDVQEKILQVQSSSKQECTGGLISDKQARTASRKQDMVRLKTEKRDSYAAP